MRTMAAQRAPPQSPDSCLVHSRQTRFRGGTLIATDVHDLSEHDRRLRDADGYRPARCPTCGCDRLHIHDHLQRVLVDEARARTVKIVRHICARAECRATWRVLPAFIARHLWREWSTVVRTIAELPHPTPRATVPPRTRRRWNARLRSAGRQLVLLLAAHDDAQVARFASVVGFDATRRDLVDLFAATRALGTHPIADLAVAIDGIERGVRLM